MSTIETDAVQAAEVEAVNKVWNQTLFYHYVKCLRGDDYYRSPIDGDRRTVCRDWHTELQRTTSLHPSVKLMLDAGHCPLDYIKLATEWPRISKTDDARLAYTRSDADGAAGRHLVTSIGKYLARHWPHVSDHARRDIASLYTPDERLIVNTVEDFVIAVELGPRSCMQSAHGTIRFTMDHNSDLRTWVDSKGMTPRPPFEFHPYAAYTPEHGWSMAQRWSTEGGQGRRLDGRALIYQGPASDNQAVFVRTYRRNMRDPVTGWSETDVALHAWLEQQGMFKVESWPEGAVLRTPYVDDNKTHIWAPYMDGNYKSLELIPGMPGYSRIAGSRQTPGQFWAEETTCRVREYGSKAGNSRLEDFACDNDYSEDECFICEDCGEPCHDDSGYWVMRDENHHVCSDCIDSYIHVRAHSSHGRGYTTYYLPSDDSVYVEEADYDIDPDHPPDNIVQLTDGNWVLRENAVLVDDEWYYVDDSCHVYVEGVGHRMRGDCVYCDDEGKWILEEDSFTTNDPDGDDEKYFSTEEKRDAYDAELRAEREKAEIEETEEV